MEAHVKSVREILHSGDQFLVPLFQRQYSWTKKEWHNLYKDVVSLIDGGEDAKHFLGPLVCMPFHPVPGEVTPYLIIDGQQRLTTLTLALAALRDIARLNSLNDFADEIHEDYLVHHRRQGLQRLKVVPQFKDCHDYELAIEGQAPGVVEGTGIIGCHSFFKRAWKIPVADTGEPMAQRIRVALTARLSLVAITIDGENPYEIFESLNGKGLPLEEADLIRNFLFMQIPSAEQSRFDDSHWKPFDDLFEAAKLADKRLKSLQTEFYRNYLMRNGRYCRKKTAYVEFKRQYSERALTAIPQVSELQRFAAFELWLRRPELCERDYLRDRLTDIQRIEVTTSHPLLLNLLDRHDRSYLSRDELDECLRDLCSFVIRRTICGEQNRGYGTWFAEAIQTMGAHPSVDLRRYWIEKGWPDDATFIARLTEFPIYLGENKKCRLFLERLERADGHKEAVGLSKLTIEHVLPQTVENDDAGRNWQAMLGPDRAREHEKWVHTLGNLTLTGYNPELGNNTFVAKQAMFARSNVSLNGCFAGSIRWGGAEIKQRGVNLGKLIAGIWPRPDGTPYVPRTPRPEELFEETIGTPREQRQARQRHTHGNLRVVINWPMLGINRVSEPLKEASDSETHAKLIGLLFAELGPQIGEKLLQIPLARTKDDPESGYRLSANPQQDFRNPNSERPFAHKRVPKTEFYLYTNSDNSTKLNDIRRVVRRLGFPTGSIEVS